MTAANNQTYLFKNGTFIQSPSVNSMSLQGNKLVATAGWQQVKFSNNKNCILIAEITYASGNNMNNGFWIYTYNSSGGINGKTFIRCGSDITTHGVHIMGTQLTTAKTSFALFGANDATLYVHRIWTE